MAALTFIFRPRLAACVVLVLAVASSLPGAVAVAAQSATVAPAVPRVQAEQELSGLTISAEQVAQALGDMHAKNVAVFDFTNLDATGWDAVGRAVAEDFRAKLDATTHTFRQIKRSKIDEWMSRDHLQPRDLAIADVAASTIRGAKVDGFVVGFLSPNASATTLKLTLRVYDPRKGNPVTITATIRFTPEFAALRGPEGKPNTSVTSATPTAPTSLSGEKVHTSPACVSCPPARYTQEAVDQKFQGMVVLIVTVEADGRAENITVIKGAPFGLTATAIAAVRGWKFTPARDGNGNAMAMRQMIEVQFHLN
jgi:TonB family protein